jgi:hypothetical protein
MEQFECSISEAVFRKDCYSHRERLLRTVASFPSEYLSLFAELYASGSYVFVTTDQSYKPHDELFRLYADILLEVVES